MNTRLLLLAVQLAATSFTATAAPAGALHATYVTADEIMLRRVLPPPPAPGSAAQKADLAAVQAAVKARTAEDETRIVAELPCTATAFAGDILGPNLSQAKTPLTLALVEHAFEDTELVVLAAKKEFARPRPFVVDPQLRVFGKHWPSNSYPSGHAACGRLIAVILAAMVPDKAQALFSRGALYGRNRMIAGTHFPSDLEAGATAGSVVAAALFRDARFKADFDRAAGETRKALSATTPAAPCSGACPRQSAPPAIEPWE